MPWLNTSCTRSDRHDHADLIRTSIFEKYDLSTKVTTRVKLPVTSQSNCVVIFVANRIGDPRNRISEKYSPRLDRLSLRHVPAPKQPNTYLIHKPTTLELNCQRLELFDFYDAV